MLLLFSETLHKMYLFSGGWSVLFYAILFVFALVKFKNFQVEFRYILYFIIASFVFEMAFMITNLVLELKNNLFISHFYCATLTLLLGLFYKYFLEKKVHKQVAVFLSGLLIIATAVLAFIDQGYLEPPKLIIGYHLLFLLLPLLLHRQLAMDPSIQNLRSEPLFWINMAFIVYNTFILLFSAVNPIVLKTSTNLAFIIGMIKNVMEPVYLVLLAIGITKLKD